MPEQDKARLEGHAARYLRALGCVPGSFDIRVECSQLEVRLKVPAHHEPPPCSECCMGLTSQNKGVPIMPADTPPGARWLSPLETKIVAALVNAGWMPSQKIADAIGWECNDTFKAICTNLVERDILESSPGRGYRLVTSN